MKISPPSHHHYAFRNGELFIITRIKRTHYRVRAWPNPRAQTSRDGRTWSFFWPEFQFVTYPVRKKKAKAQDLSVVQMDLGLNLGRPTPPAQTKTETFDLLRQTVPVRYAMALAPFSSRQWNALVFLHFNRDFYDLLKASPALAYYLSNHPPVSVRIYKETRTFFPELLAMKQMELLGLLDLPQTKQMTGILKKIRPSSVDIENLFDLRTIGGNSDALKMLSHVKSINAGVLSLVSSSILPHLTPSFLEEVSCDGGNHYYPAIFGSFAHCLELHAAIYPQRLFPKILQMERLTRYGDELAREYIQLQRSRDDRPLPPPPIPDSEDIQALTSAEALHREGREQRNCVETHTNQVRSGKYYIYRVLKPQRATLSIALYRSQWIVSELWATCNQPAMPDTVQKVQDWLESNQIGLGSAEG